MRIAIWSVCGLLLAFWTAGAWMAAEAVRWASTLVASGEAADLGRAIASWPVPAWLSFWIDPGWLRGLQEMALWTLDMVRQGLPFVGTALVWLVPLTWLVWGVGAVALLALAALANWLPRVMVRRLQ